MRKMGWLVGLAAQFLAVAPAFAAETEAKTVTVVTERETIQVEKFGNSNQWAPNVELNLSNTASSQVSALYFVGENLALGLGVGGGFTNHTNDRSAGLNVVPKLAYNIELSDKVSILPTLSVDYRFDWARTETAPAVTGTAYRNGLTAELFVPVMAHVGNRFFIGLGPQASLDVVARNTINGAPATGVLGPELALKGNFGSRNFAVGVRSVVGAWL